MAVKDKIVRWFMQNVIVPRNEIIDNPGFLVTRFTQDGTEVYLREVGVPESVFVVLEQAIAEKYGKPGVQMLYSAGKKFSHHYAHKSVFPSVKTNSKKDVEKFLYNFVRYAEATSYGRINYSVDMEKKSAAITLKNYMICPHNGLGYLFTSGSLAGIWSYLLSDSRLEAVQVKCQGRKFANCEVICGTVAQLDKMSLDFCKQPRMKEWPPDNYSQINMIKPAKYAKTSFQSLINGRYLSYKSGVVERKKQRYFIIESSFIYILENELKKLKGANDLLFDLAFESGRVLAKREKDAQRFVSDIVSAFGWGDCLVTGDSVISEHFPWSHLFKSSRFFLYRGLLSGILTEITGKTVKLRKIARSDIGGSVVLKISK